MDLKSLLLSALQEYSEGEEIYGDNAYLEIDTATPRIRLISDDEADESPYDCYEVIPLLAPNPENPSSWRPDMDAIDDLLAEVNSGQ